ncbi:hypothetical protein B0T17DRAFT_455686, partial [Bombardia bombarda]
SSPLPSPLPSPSPSHAQNDTAEILTYPDANTDSHHDLASFLQYTERTGLDRRSTVFVGTHYEYTVASVLSAYGFSLRRIGGQFDFGIDLLGTWAVPSTTSSSSPSPPPSANSSHPPLKVLLSCKVSMKTGPALARELEGAFVGAPAGWRGSGVLGLLVSQRPATKGVRDALGRSRWPMGYISCTRAGYVQQMLWNRRAEEEGLAGVGVGMRY